VQDDNPVTLRSGDCVSVSPCVRTIKTKRRELSALWHQSLYKVKGGNLQLILVVQNRRKALKHFFGLDAANLLKEPWIFLLN